MENQTEPKEKVKTYYHQEKRDWDVGGNYEHQGYLTQSDGPPIDRGHAFVQRTFSERKVPHNEREVLVVQIHETKDGRPLNYVLVPGYIQSRKGRTSEVVPLDDEEDKSQLIEKIRESTQGPINFWS